MAQNDFNFVSFLLRLLFAALLVFLTYNPSGYSWIGMIKMEVELVYLAASGIVLLIGWVMFLRATWNSLGPIGTLLAVGFFGVFIWLLVHWKLISLENPTAITWVVMVVLSFVLAVGMSWSHVRRRISGQYDTDEIEG
ncbi:MAG: DUF6524 family protein [Gammaproteobacteria bacterium]|nr:DUF6524 family protein [Gammaproteobacteria bacterium]